MGSWGMRPARRRAHSSARRERTSSAEQAGGGEWGEAQVCIGICPNSRLRPHTIGNHMRQKNHIFFHTQYEKLISTQFFFPPIFLHMDTSYFHQTFFIWICPCIPHNAQFPHRCTTTTAGLDGGRYRVEWAPQPGVRWSRRKGGSAQPGPRPVRMPPGGSLRPLGWIPF